MANANALVPILKKVEGGFVYGKYDGGGATMCGITLSTYKAYCRAKGKKTPTAYDLKRMSDDEWLDIFKTMFWDKCKADSIESQAIANIFVDWHFNSGRYAITNVQKLVGVAADGVVGPKTLGAINGYEDQEELFNRIWNRRKSFYENIVRRRPSQKIFLKGWMNRLNNFKYFENELY